MFACNAGIASLIRKTAMAAMIPSRTTPAPVEAKRKGPSPELRREAARRVAGPPPRVRTGVVMS
ncbi:hypothetical protein GCM10018965_087010 [Nonomuraea roseola]